jgi:hypothetical protein
VPTTTVQKMIAMIILINDEAVAMVSCLPVAGRNTRENTGDDRDDDLEIQRLVERLAWNPIDLLVLTADLRRA